jgi:hypothetical protein
MEPITFKMPGSLEKYKYADDDDDEKPFPMTILLLGANGELLPTIVLDDKWAQETYLHDLPMLKLGRQEKEEEKKSSFLDLPVARQFSMISQSKAPESNQFGFLAN